LKNLKEEPEGVIPIPQRKNLKGSGRGEPEGKPEGVIPRKPEGFKKT
jgi:hypothetical protein